MDPGLLLLPRISMVQQTGFEPFTSRSSVQYANHYTAENPLFLDLKLVNSNVSFAATSELSPTKIPTRRIPWMCQARDSLSVLIHHHVSLGPLIIGFDKQSQALDMNLLLCLILLIGPGAIGNLPMSTKLTKETSRKEKYSGLRL